MINLEFERKAFEDGYANHLVERDDSGFYINDGIQNSWEKHLLKAEIDALKAQLAKVENEKNSIMLEIGQKIEKSLEKIKPTISKIESGEYVVVPKSPTLKMLKVADKHVMDCNATPESAYKAMIEAAQEQNND